METRKVQKVGGGTYTISIPAQWARDYEIEAGESLYLYTFSDGSLVIRRSENEKSKLASVQIGIEQSDPRVVGRRLLSAYMAGFNEIALTTQDQFSSDQRKQVTEVTRDLIGVEITEETGSRIVVRELLETSDVSIRQSVLQLQFMTLSMCEAAISALIGSNNEIEYIFQRDDEVDRIFQLVTRYFNRALSDMEEVDRLGINRVDLFGYYLTARYLERASDHAVKIGYVVDRFECGISDEMADELDSIGTDVRQVLQDASDAIINENSHNKAHTALDIRDEINDRVYAIDRTLTEKMPREAYLLTRVLDSLNRTANYGGNIAEIALQRQSCSWVNEMESDAPAE